MVENKTQRTVIKIVAYFGLSLALLACIIPFWVVIMASLSNEQSITMYGYSLWPDEFSLTAYKTIMKDPTALFGAYRTTIITTLCGVTLTTLVTSMAAYPLARRDYKLRNVVSFYFLFTMLFSGGTIPIYIVITQYLHLKNNLLVLILPLCFGPWNCFVLRTYFSKIPPALIEAAKIDGASEFKTFFKIVFPMSVTGIATIMVMVALTYWNDWYNCLMYMTDEKVITLQYFLQRTMSNIEQMMKNQDMGLISTAEIPSESARMAMCVLAAGPMVFVFMFFQKYFAKGINVGSVKG